MTDTSTVPRKWEGSRPGWQPLVDEQVADELLGKAQAEASICSVRTACYRR